MGKDLEGKEIGAGFTQRKDGVYHARYTNRWGDRISIYDKNLRELRKKYSIAVGKDLTKVNIRDKNNVLLKEWYEKWYKVYKESNLRGNSLRLYSDIIQRNILPYLGDEKISDITKTDIQLLITKLYELGYGFERQNKVRILLNDMFQRAYEDGIIIKNPTTGVKIISKKESHARSLTLEEQKVFLAYCENAFYGNLFNVAIYTGLRPGELFALTADDIIFDKNNDYIDVKHTLVYQKYLEDSKKTFHLEDPKTKSSFRHVPISNKCKYYLEKQLRQKEIIAEKNPEEKNDFLFTTKFNTPLNSVLYSQAIAHIVEEINLLRPYGEEFEKFSGHTFRHTFATRCFEKGISPKVVQKYLGHATLQMTMDLYTHVSDDLATNEIEKLNFEME